MSDKKQTHSKEHHLDVDESFIHSLYQHLPHPKSSTELDNKILAAAHKAVNAKPQDITLPKQQPNSEQTSVAEDDTTAMNQLIDKARQDRTAKKTTATPQTYLKKRPDWLKPTAAAAMLMLVISVSYQQIFDPNAPLNAESYLTHAELEVQQPKTKLSTENNHDDGSTIIATSAKAPSLKKTKEKAKVRAMRDQEEQQEVFTAASADAAQQPKKSSRYNELALKKDPSEKSIASVFYQHNKKMLKSSHSNTEPFQQQKAMTLPPILEKNQFLQTYQQSQWYFLQQDPDNYWLYPTNNLQEIFRVNKQIFSIKESNTPLKAGDKVTLRLKKLTN